MLEQTLATHIGVSQAEVSRLLKMKQSQIYTDPNYQRWLHSLDAARLNDTLQLARAAYEKKLPYFTNLLKTDYGLADTPMSAFTLGNWVVGFLQYPEQISDLARMHNKLPREAVVRMLPEMIGMLDDLPQARAEWQRALALMALPLAAVRD